MSNTNLLCPEYLKHWSADIVAENLFGDNNGIADKTYAHIWNVIVPQMEIDQKASLKQIGYDHINHYYENVGGDDGTLREMGEMQKYWHLLKDEMKEFLIQFASQRLKQEEEDAREDLFNNPNL